MTEAKPPDGGVPDAGDDAGANDAAAARPADPPALERRQFVRQVSSDAVSLAGRMYSLSRVITRSVAAAGQAVADELGGIEAASAVEGSPGGTEAGGTEAGRTEAGADAGFEPPVDSVAPRGDATSTPEPPSPAPAASPPPVAPPPRPVLEPQQVATLESALRAVIAVNRAGLAPQLSSAAIHWDGATVRFASVGWSRRTTLLGRDPRVALFIEAGEDTFLLLTGSATILHGPAAREAMLPLLLREAAGDADAADPRWAELVAEDPDRVVIVVEPDQVLSGRH